MFGKKEPKALEEKVLNLLASGTKFEGNLTIEAGGLNRLDGELFGHIKGRGTLIIGEKGFVKGDIHMEQVIVYGKVEGNIKTSYLELKSTGQILGNLEVEYLMVEKGAIFVGECQMKEREGIPPSEA